MIDFFIKFTNIKLTIYLNIFKLINNMIEIFLREKPSKLMICLKDGEKKWTLTRLSKESGMSYVYVLKLMKKLKKGQLITEKKEGRNRVIKLTQIGITIASLIEQLVKSNQKHNNIVNTKTGF